MHVKEREASQEGSENPEPGTKKTALGAGSKEMEAGGPGGANGASLLTTEQVLKGHKPQNLRKVLTAATYATGRRPECLGVGKGYNGQPMLQYCSPCPIRGEHTQGKPSLFITLDLHSGWVIIKCWGCYTAGDKGGWFKRAINALSLKSSDLAPSKDWQPIDVKDLPGVEAKYLSPEELEALWNLRDQVYGHISRTTYLLPEHMRDLTGRGLSEPEIQNRGYFSAEPVSTWTNTSRDDIPYSASQKLLYKKCEIQGVANEVLEHLPGFSLRNLRKKGKKEESAPKGVCFRPNGGEGMFVPCRDLRGRIIGGQIRTFDPKKLAEGKKYIWLYGGGSSSHVPLGFQPGEIIWVVEGLLKADICTHFGYNCIGVGGATCGRIAIPLLKELRPGRVVIAWDSDQWVDGEAGQLIKDFAKALKSEGLEPMTAVWAFSRAKGLDDALRLGLDIRQCPVTDLSSELRALVPQSPAELGKGIKTYCGWMAGTTFEQRAFRNPDMKIIRALAENQAGLTKEELMDKTGGMSIATLNRTIRELKADGQVIMEGDRFQLAQIREPEPVYA